MLFLLPCIHPISNLEPRSKSSAAREGRDPCAKLTPLHRQEGTTLLLWASCTNCDNAASQESNRGILWSRAVTSDALPQVQCSNISSLSYFPWKYPWHMWESVDNVLDLRMSVPANWSFICSQSCDMAIAKAAWHPWVSPLHQVLELTLGTLKR